MHSGWLRRELYCTVAVKMVKLGVNSRPGSVKALKEAASPQSLCLALMLHSVNGKRFWHFPRGWNPLCWWTEQTHKHSFDCLGQMYYSTSRMNKRKMNTKPNEKWWFHFTHCRVLWMRVFHETPRCTRVDPGHTWQSRLCTWCSLQVHLQCRLMGHIWTCLIWRFAYLWRYASRMRSSFYCHLSIW